MRANFQRLAEGEPVLASEAALGAGQSQDQDIDATVRPAGRGVLGQAERGRHTGPGLHPGRAPLFKLANDLVGDLLVEAGAVGKGFVGGCGVRPIPPRGLPDDVIVGVPRRERISRTTLVDIDYHTPIDVNDTADIKASVRQEERVWRMVGPAGAQHPDYYSGGPISDSDPRWPQPILRLEWPITLWLDGTGLKWTENSIPIKEGTPLPVTEHWVPRAKTAGDYVMKFRLRDINHAAESHGFASVSDKVKVTVNGTEQDAGGSDDVPLPISIWTHGIPARWFDRVTFFGTAISGLEALMVGVFGTGWGTALLKLMRRPKPSVTICEGQPRY
jgi:hypothetical protein